MNRSVSSVLGCLDADAVCYHHRCPNVGPPWVWNLWFWKETIVLHSRKYGTQSSLKRLLIPISLVVQKHKWMLWVYLCHCWAVGVHATSECWLPRKSIQLLWKLQYLRGHHHLMFAVTITGLECQPHRQSFCHKVKQTNQLWGKCGLLNKMGLSTPSCEAPQPKSGHLLNCYCPCHHQPLSSFVSVCIQYSDAQNGLRWSCRQRENW